MDTEISANSPQPAANQRKRNALLVLLVAAFMQGFADPVLQNVAGDGLYRLFSLLLIVANIVLIVHWFVLDAREHSFPLNQKWILGLVVFWPLVALVYFFKTRGKQFWKPLLGTLVFMLAWFLCAALGVGLAALAGFALPQPV